MKGRLRVSVSELQEGRLLLDEAASRYVSKVHRCEEGDFLSLFDPVAGLVAQAKICGQQGRALWLEVARVTLAVRQTMPVRLLLGVGKGDKPEQAIRDVTALGAEELVLVSCERSVAKSAGGTRKERQLRVAEQVARQCERGALPAISGPLSFGEAIALGDEAERPAHRFMCVFDPEARPLLAHAQEVKWGEERVELLVGPEGGLSPAEIRQGSDEGYRAVSLGPYVLRTEAACTFALSTLRAASELSLSVSSD